MMKAELTKDGRHRFKWMTYEGQNVRIDRDIAHLMSLMWRLGIETSNSCHAHCSFLCRCKNKKAKDKNGEVFHKKVLTKNCHNNVWITFPSTRSLEQFLNIVAEYSEEDGSMYHLMNCDRVMATPKTKRLKDSWAYCFVMNNNGVTGYWGRPIINGKRSTCELWVETGCKKNKLVIAPQLTFPRAHIEHVTKKLQQALDKR